MKKEIMNTVIKPTLQARYSARKEILENEPLVDTIDHTVSIENREVINEIDKILDEHNSKWGKPNSVKRAMNECIDPLKSLYNIIMYLPSVLIWLITLGQLNILSSRPYQTEKIITFASVSSTLSDDSYKSIQKEQEEYEKILNNTEKKEVDTELSEKELQTLFNEKLKTLSPNQAIDAFYITITKPQDNSHIDKVNTDKLSPYSSGHVSHEIAQIKKAPTVASNDRTAYPSNTSTKEIKPHK